MLRTSPLEQDFRYQGRPRKMNRQYEYISHKSSTGRGQLYRR